MVGNNQDFCHDCQVSCNSYNYGPCVFWRGPAVSYFRIPNWKEENNFSLQEAVTNIANKTAEYVNLNLVEAPYYFKDTQVNPGPAAQLALEILKSLNTDDVVVKNSLLTLGRTSSVYSMNLGTRAGTVGLIPTDTNYSTLTFNIEEAVFGLPNDYKLIKSRVALYNIDPSSSLSSRLVDTGDLSGEFQVPGNKFPLLLDINIDIATPGGLVTMVKKISLDAPTKVSIPVVFDIEDRTTKTGGGDITQTAYNLLVESAIAQINRRIDSYRKLNLGGCEQVKYVDDSLTGAVGAHSGYLCNLYNRFKKLGKEPINGIDCKPGCKEETTETTLQEAITELYKANCTAKGKIEDLENSIKELKQKIEICCNK